MQTLLRVLTELEQGDYATSGRDYGRGVAFATKKIREAMAEDRKRDNLFRAMEDPWTMEDQA